MSQIAVDYDDIKEIHRVLFEHYKSIWHRDPQGLKEKLERHEKWSHYYAEQFEKRMNAFDNLIALVQEKVEKLEQHKNYQIDENRKISRRVDELEKHCDKIDKFCSCCGNKNV